MADLELRSRSAHEDEWTEARAAVRLVRSSPGNVFRISRPSRWRVRCHNSIESGEGVVPLSPAAAAVATVEETRTIVPSAAGSEPGRPHSPPRQRRPGPESVYPRQAPS